MLSRKQLSANQRAWQSTALSTRDPHPGLQAAQIDNMLTVSVAGAYGLSVDQETNFWTNKQLRCFARRHPSSFDTTATQSAEPPLFSSRSVDSIDCVSTTHRIASHRASKPTAGGIAYYSRQQHQFGDATTDERTIAGVF
jgi:hypothetical protein